jgi:2-pyrone-4,6-dicarboxylate lactonase
LNDELRCEASDPRPRPPKQVLPPLSCDTHAHVFGPVDRFPYWPGRGYTPPETPFERFDALHTVLGVDRAVVVQPSVYGTDNAALLDALARRPSHLRGVVALGPSATDRQLDELHEAGVRGVRVNLVDRGGMPFDSIDDVVEFSKRLAPRGWHIEFLVHVHEFLEIETLGTMATESVVGHFGYMPTLHGVDDPGYSRFLKVVEQGRVWVKLSGPYRITGRDRLPYDDVQPFVRQLGATRPDRLLWGSDWPHPINPKAMENAGDLLSEMVEWLDASELTTRVLVDNPAVLYGFE